MIDPPPSASGRGRCRTAARSRHARPGLRLPESGQTVVNVTDGKLVRLTVGDELFDVRYGKLRLRERTLELRAGTLTRRVESGSHAPARL
jgi:alpha,alpha-trehalose phosphorylase